MKKLLPQILVLTVIDFIIIWIWIKNINPDPSVSIYIIFLVPLVFFINLIIAGTLYFFKKELAKLFIINSLISVVLMYVLFGEGVDRYLNETLDEWEFKKADTTFSISHWKDSDSFMFSYSTDPNSSTGFLVGKINFENDQILLLTDSTKYVIKKGYLFGFRQDSIKLRKMKW